MRTFWQQTQARWNSHTMKREIAIIALLFWGVLTIHIFWKTDVALIGALSSIYGTASTSIWLFVVAAFGMDALSKQINPKVQS